ncbi:hypothetical protein L1987_87958 [Smallanthus sonchifolius]|nr:hypothetical protein L1987_87958 [Smallanthus sonchifolius]
MKLKAKGKNKRGKRREDAKGKAIATKQAATKPPKDTKCYHYYEIGHWKRNCPKYIIELKKGKISKTSTSRIFVIELYSFSRKSWVFDTGCCSHICNNLQGLRRARELKAGDLELHVGNGAKVAVKAIRWHWILFPSGLYLNLDNVCYVPSLTRIIISVSCLCEQGSKYVFDGDDILAYMNDVFYFEDKPHNGIYEIDVSSSCNDNSIYTLSTKRMKSDFNQNYIWHWRIGHISKKRLSKLQSDGILESTSSDTREVCKSCLSGKITKAPFTGIGARASDLLGLIHTDVCGPFRTMSRTG